ncbi:MAG: glucans biosynthesis glucosyltransferase MdoH, partial [Burkholderiales bacterium]|nr:glucans biosynthesis glucosyltransferase MdoH [Burkholderiales bacterium]
TAPRAAGHTTMYARIQQFATRVYGPVFVAGLHFFQLGEAHYWGHNAILRVAPFRRHCALARLPGKGAMSGEILSHDFVEAALMRRAGWAVWIAYDLEGSYEEMPPNLIDELKRDRRWCQGNLINVRLSTARGLHPAHRAVFMMGVMAYCSAPLWFTFLMLSTVLLGVHTLVEPEYFTRSEQLFPVWPEWHPQRGMTLYAATAILLFLPKILGVALFVLQGARHFGGRLRLMASMAVEFAFSALLAPIRMLFHTHFVLSTFAGLKIQWKSPPREDTETQWSEALRHHGLHSLLGLIWAGDVNWLNPSFLLWLLPVVGALMLSVPLSVLSSRVTMGRRLQRLGLFVIPEEELPPRELVETRARAAQTPEPPGFQDAIVDPAVNDLMRGALLRRRRNTPMDQKRRSELVPLALREGPDALSAKDKSALLLDPIALDALHRQLKTATGGVHRRWFERRPTAEVGGAAA